MAEVPIESQDGHLWYPGTGLSRDEIRVHLWHVRAAEDLLISYDFDRDGYVIKMVPYTDVECDEEAGPPEEVAFVPAWLVREEPGG